MKSANVKFLHLCMEKAYALTGLMSLSDSALAINAWSPEKLLVVSDPSGAAACRFGEITKVYSIRFPGAELTDGKGPAFFGSFLGEYLNSGSLPLSLAAGHRFAAAMATGNWKTRQAFARALPPPATAVMA